MKHMKKASIFLALALAFILTLAPAAYATGTAEEDVSSETAEVVEEAEAVEETTEEAPKSNSVMSIVIVGVVVAVIVIAGTEIHRDNKRKESRK